MDSAGSCVLVGKGPVETAVFGSGDDAEGPSTDVTSSRDCDSMATRASEA